MPFAASLLRRPGRSLGIAVAVSVLVLPGLGRLRLTADVCELLPEGSAPAAALRRQADLFGGLEQIYVMVGAAPGGADIAAADLAAAAERLAAQLRRHPEVESAQAGLREEEVDYFRRGVIARAPLFLPPAARAEMEARLEPAAIGRRVEELRALLTSPLGGAAGEWITVDPLGLAELLPGHGPERTVSPVDPLTGAFLAADGTAALVVVRPVGESIDPAFGRRLERALRTAEAATERKTGRSLTVEAVGGALYAAADERILRQDLRRTVGGSALAAGLLLTAGYGGLLPPLLILAPLLPGLLWTAGVAGAAVGKVSAVGIGFAAVLVGLGVDYSIHLVSRVVAARRAGEAVDRSVELALSGAGPGVVAAALTTAAGFLVLGFAALRPIRELGLLVGVGTLSILAATFLVAPALLRLVPVPVTDRLGWKMLGGLVSRATRVAVRRRGVIVIGGILISSVAAAGLSRLGLDADLRGLRPDDHPMLEAEQRLAETFGLGVETATVLVPGRRAGEALGRAAAVASVLRTHGPQDLVVVSPSDWLLPHGVAEWRARRLESLPFGRAAERLEEELRTAGLDPDAFHPGLAVMRTLAAGRPPAAPTPPEELTRLVRRRGETTWVAIPLRAPAGTWPDGLPRELHRRILRRVQEAEIASVAAVGAEMRRLAARDLARLAWLALAAVVAVVVITFRGRPRPVLLALTPVLVGPLWALGLWGWSGRELDLVSLIALPVLLGIGIDNGLHALLAERRHAARDLRQGLQEAGPAIVLTALTTCAGFASLALSRLPGLRQGGVLVAVGILACLVATLMLPALDPRSRR